MGRAELGWVGLDKKVKGSKWTGVRRIPDPA